MAAFFCGEKMPGGYAELSTKIVSKSISVQHLVYYAKRSEWGGHKSRK